VTKAKHTGVWVPELQCCALAVIYNWRTRAGIIVLPEYNCTDMAGAIALFERLDPHVRTIVTTSGDDVDTRYEQSGGEWRAYRATVRVEDRQFMVVPVA
jgi:hypothetical protein